MSCHLRERPIKKKERDPSNTKPHQTRTWALILETWSNLSNFGKESTWKATHIYIYIYIYFFFFPSSVLNKKNFIRIKKNQISKSDLLGIGYFVFRRKKIITYFTYNLTLLREFKHTLWLVSNILENWYSTIWIGNIRMSTIGLTVFLRKK